MKKDIETIKIKELLLSLNTQHQNLFVLLQYLSTIQKI